MRALLKNDMSDDSDYFIDEYDDDACSFVSTEEGGDISTKAEEASSRWRVLDASELRKCQNEAIGTVVSTLVCKRSEALVLLRYFRWDIDSLMTAIAERDRQDVFRAAGAQSSRSNDDHAGMRGGAACLVCMEDVAPAHHLEMDCGHTFCRNCWFCHFQVRIAEGQSCNIPCMAPRCGAICSDDVVCEVLAQHDPATLAKYEHCILQSYIDDNSHAQWCPSVPNCGRAIEALDDVYCEPVCDCGQHFCFKCGLEAHSPCTCKMWADWVAKERNDSETLHWLQAHTKPCPKCTVPVEKDGGCNLVVCRSCRQAFCWLCGAKTGLSHTWTQIEGHTCGAWQAEMQSRADDSRSRIERYLHYFKHYKAHRDSSRSEDRSREVAELIPNLVKYNICGTVDWAYLVHGDALLRECRRVLANSYVFAYFMFDNVTFAEDLSAEESERLQHLFEDTQQTIGEAVEKLSHHMHTTLLSLHVRVSDSMLAEGTRAAAAAAEVSDMPQLPLTYTRLRNTLEGVRALEDAKTRARTSPVEQEQRVRLAIVNLTNSIDMRISRLFSLIETDVLAPVSSCNVQIAPRSPLLQTTVI